MSKILQDISIGDNLRKLRGLKGMTQTQLCAQMQIRGRPMQQSTYAQIETGVRNIFISDLIVLKQVLETSYDDIFKDLIPIEKFDRKPD